jgi:transposase
MKDLLKQSVGIDISKSDFHCCVCRLDKEMKTYFSSIKKFKNSKKGFNALLKWSKSQLEPNISTTYLMEATGVYYEELAYFLHDKGLNVQVVLPNMSKNYLKSLNIKTKTDSVDAKYLSQFGVERDIPLWNPPPAFFKKLRSLTRYHCQLQEQKTVFANMLHSVEYTHEPDAFVEKSIKQSIKVIEKQIKDCEKRIKDLMAKDPEFSERIKNVTTIKGVGIMTAATIISETQGFYMFNNIKQLVSYSGYDVVERQSGSSVKGKTRISKKGNKYIRRALYFPAISAVRFSKHMKDFYTRIFERSYQKMVSYVAVQRKLLVLLKEGE